MEFISLMALDVKVLKTQIIKMKRFLSTYKKYRIQNINKQLFIVFYNKAH